ncbi:hypothetical protein NDU88_005327 [Pleurodeles waltl]|uniref:Uncharacterized protein n=1 Tax=Pleurodeles waltl TaxID=8319 RepID=A0AAV7LNT2_PLEWA|nr:hypothetical protein NDU88_005327 [Pleurodeles waltl]
MNRKLRALNLSYSLLFPARLRVVDDSATHFFGTPEAVWDWLESTDLISQLDPDIDSPIVWDLQSHEQRHGKKWVAASREVRHAPDLEQIVQERQNALQSAAAISVLSVASDVEAEITNSDGEDGSSPEMSSELGSSIHPAVTPQTADKLL